MAKNVPDISGQKFGRWTALYQVEHGTGGERRYLCRCQCGTEKALRRSSITLLEPLGKVRVVSVDDGKGKK